MAKFCGKCGRRLDEKTGLCPNCDAGKIAAQQPYQYIRRDPSPYQGVAGFPQGRHKRAQRAAMTTGQKVQRFSLKLILPLVLLALIVGGVVAALAYCGVIDMPFSEKANNEARISAGWRNTVGVRSDGSVVATKVTDKDYDFGQSDVSDWRDIVAVSAGDYHTVGLRSDGSVVATKITENDFDVGQCDVSEWRDIVAVSERRFHTVGLHSDGSVVATKIANESVNFGQCDVSGSEWQGIVAISAGMCHTVGLRSDGSVVATKVTDKNWDFSQYDVSDWHDIVAISAGYYHTVGLRSDGSVVATKVTDKDRDFGQSDVSEWHDIVAVSAGQYHTVGLRSDGSVVATKITDKKRDFGQSDVSEWHDIVAVSAGMCHTVGLRSDGSVVSTGDNDCGQCDVSDWRDMMVCKSHSIFAKKDGVSGGKTASSANSKAQKNDSGKKDAENFIGTWEISAMETDGENASEEDLALLKDMGINITLDLKEDGTASLTLTDEAPETGTWKASSATTCKIIMGGETLKATLDGDVLSMKEGNDKLEFKKLSKTASPAKSKAPKKGNSKKDAKNTGNHSGKTNTVWLEVEAASGATLAGEVKRDAGDYVIADSSSREYTMSELQKLKLTDAELCIAWNEPFAREGYVFRNSGLQEYFESCSWYVPKDRTVDVSQIGMENVKRLQEIAGQSSSAACWMSLAQC